MCSWLQTPMDSIVSISQAYRTRFTKQVVPYAKFSQHCVYGMLEKSRQFIEKGSKSKSERQRELVYARHPLDETDSCNFLLLDAWKPDVREWG